MAQIKQIGPGRKTTGTIDGVTYVTRNGITYARSTPTMPFSAYNTPAAKKRQAIFKFVQMHLKLHLRTIKQTFTPKGNGTATNRYYSLNGKALTLALNSLAELYCAGQDVTIDNVEQAISDYAAEHPKSIKIASKSGYAEVYLTGPWPETITLNALTGARMERRTRITRITRIPEVVLTREVTPVVAILADQAVAASTRETKPLVVLTSSKS